MEQPVGGRCFTGWDGGKYGFRFGVVGIGRRMAGAAFEGADALVGVDGEAGGVMEFWLSVPETEPLPDLSSDGVQMMDEEGLRTAWCLRGLTGGVGFDLSLTHVSAPSTKLTSNRELGLREIRPAFLRTLKN